MKRNNKKGFTIVELVIVIAVIAILSAVLIPTFGNIIENANESARDQEARNALTNVMIDTPAADLAGGLTGVIVIDGYYYEVTAGNFVNIDDDQTTTKIDGNVLYCNTAHTAGTTCEKCGTATPAATNP